MALEASNIYQQQDLFDLNNYCDNIPYTFLLETLSTSNNIIPSNNNYSFIDQLNNNITPNYDNINLFEDHYNDNYNYNYNNDICEIGLSNVDDYEWGLEHSSPDQAKSSSGGGLVIATETIARPPRRRRANVKVKNKEDVENQRMTHIFVERNRRKQMNEYLNVLRSLMPDSYVQRGDQASIVGGAINYVKELEHNLQQLSSANNNKKQINKDNNNNDNVSSKETSSLPFQEFFTFPQYSTIGHDRDNDDQTVPRGGGVVADVEVTMVESHANLKIRLKKNSTKQLSKLVQGILCLRLTILHINVNTSEDGLVFYSFSLKVEDESKLSTVDEIAREVYNLLVMIQQDNQPIFNCQ